MLKQRIITAVILIPLALLGVFALSPFFFSLFVGGIVLLAGWEWANLAGLTQPPARLAYVAGLVLALFGSQYLPLQMILVLAVLIWLAALMLVLTYPGSAIFWRHRSLKLIVGLMVLVPAWNCLVWLKEAENSSWLIVYLFALIWGADIGAYFFGKRFGKHKLAAKVSPGKSWEGVYGAIAVTTLVAIGAGVVQQKSFAQLMVMVLFAWLIVTVSVLGDLLESMFKRERGVKDSSNLLPGHGGVMDRIDSLTAAIPVFCISLLVTGL
ncbi:phosphatidate cytidylyltransferase [Spartinivicinus poritis]|uniref:Phosphatidate cytidylyltransferase n=1 Tax=Spartinivicinus poritis TaxID=2994640 RepID=A0ABT5U2E0_9GAMM|nr:phosphatidate cytidylyltransferase [Spartinivicinus sp. A2-2]MDE1460395.1 phosphatidate cytidylyltransferase [Spartinivicinus sp. A2-2]